VRDLDVLIPLQNKPTLRSRHIVVTRYARAPLSPKQGLRRMAQFRPAWLERRRRYYTRPDGHRWIRPNGKLYLKPKSYESKTEPNPPDLSAEIEELLRLRSELAAIKVELKLRRFLREKAYNPNQPRDDHGRWTIEGGDSATENQRPDRIRVAQLGGTVTDADGRPY
jgi:hypothetical protein